MPTAVYIDIVITEAIVGVTGIMEPVIALTRAEYRRYFCSDSRTPAVTYRDIDIVIKESIVGMTDIMEPVIALTRARYRRYVCSDSRTPAITYRDIDIVITVL